MARWKLGVDRALTLNTSQLVDRLENIYETERNNFLPTPSRIFNKFISSGGYPRGKAIFIF